MATLRDVQKRMTRQLLIDSAVEVFQEFGYASTTVDQIAKRAGATRATFYLHFASKGELVTSIVDRTDEMLTTPDDPPLPAVVASGDLAVLRMYLERKFDQWPQVRDYMLITQQATATEPELLGTVDDWYDHAISSMVEGLDSVERYEPSHRRIRCSLAFGQLIFISQRWFRHGWAVERDVMLDEMIRSWRALLFDAA